MKTIHFPYVAFALGLLLMLIVTHGAELNAQGSTALPLLTLLIINECGFFITAVGSFIGFKQVITTQTKIMKNPLYFITSVICLLLLIQFALLGIELWPFQ